MPGPATSTSLKVTPVAATCSLMIAWKAATASSSPRSVSIFNVNA